MGLALSDARKLGLPLGHCAGGSDLSILINLDCFQDGPCASQAIEKHDFGTLFRDLNIRSADSA